MYFLIRHSCWACSLGDALLLQSPDEWRQGSRYGRSSPTTKDGWQRKLAKVGHRRPGATRLGVQCLKRDTARHRGVRAAPRSVRPSPFEARSDDSDPLSEVTLRTVPRDRAVVPSSGLLAPLADAVVRALRGERLAALQAASHRLRFTRVVIAPGCRLLTRHRPHHRYWTVSPLRSTGRRVCRRGPRSPWPWGCSGAAIRAVSAPLELVSGSRGYRSNRSLSFRPGLR